MYICNDCGEIFSDHKIIEDPRPYGIQTVYERFGVCPHCESDDWSEAVECVRCGEIVTKDDCEIGESLEYLCNHCYEEIYG